MVTTPQFCTNLISEFFKPSGSLSNKSQLSLDNNRPLLNVSIIENFSIDDVGKIELEINGLNIKLGKNLFRQNCFEFNCFEEEGITTYIKDISDICLINNNVFLTKKQRDAANINCYLNSSNQATFFIRGTQDIEGAVYLADIGIINNTSGVFSVIDRNIPFYFKNKKNSLSCLSLRKIPKGIKCALIKRVTKTTYEEIGLVYGELDNQFYFPHNILQSNRKFTAKNQSINLENLSINLLLLSSFKEYEDKENQIIYRSNNFSSPEIENTVIKSSETLTNLILTDNLPQQGSIPFSIATYLNTEDQYNSTADEQYLTKTKDCFEQNCFDKNCFETIANNNLINRSINNRSIAWTIQYLCSYTVNYNIDLSQSILELSQYLLNQKDKNTSLFYKGWDQIVIEEECEELTDDTLDPIKTETAENLCQENTDDVDTSNLYYSTSLSINKEILTSTNITIFLALLKTFEITRDFNYLIEADNLYINIQKYLLNSNNLFKHSLTVSDNSVEAVTYQLILNLVLEEYNSIQDIIEFFKNRLNAIRIQENEQVFVGTSLVTLNTIPVEVAPTAILNSDSDLNLFTPTLFDNIETVDDIFKYNYLITSSLLHLNNKLYVPYIETLQEKLNIIKTKVEDIRQNSTLVFAASCLIDNKSFLSFDTVKFNSLLEFNNYQLQKTLNLNKLLLNTPKDYGWFASNKLTKSSNIGSIYYAIAQTLAKNAVEYETIQQNISLDNMYGIVLNKKAREYNLTRFTKESDSLLRNRIKIELYNRGINKGAIENRLLNYSSPVNITDNYNNIISTEDNSTINIYTNNWGEGYLQGLNTSNSNISTFNFNQPVEEDVYQEVYKLKPAGTKVHIRENLTFFIQNNSTFINIKEIDTDTDTVCDNIDSEIGEVVITENNNIICSEDI